MCSAEWLNNVQANIRNIQAECIAILKATGFTPDDTKDGQLWEAIQAAIKSQVPAASVTAAGITQLSSSVASDSETIAATSKAVKIAMDNASARLAKERNLADLTNIPMARQSLELGDSATRNVGTTANTVAAGDDSRIIATKKALDDTQIGSSEQAVMWIASADDLSNLPAGARRFAKNNAGVTVLPSADYCYIEVLAKRDTAGGTCISVVEFSNPGNVWIGVRNNVPVDAGFTWVQQYNENHRPPQQAMPSIPDALVRGNNLSDVPNKAAGVSNLGLTDTVNRASHVDTDGDVQGYVWGGWLSTWLNNQLAARTTADWVRQNFLSGFRLGGVESAQVWRAYGYNDTPPYVITGVMNGNADDLIDNVTRRPLQMYINGWRNIDWL
ncbi:TPA: hypothetical protein G8O67_005005 [Salmonella enterica]|uniref:Phage tail protein n=1 Tax=Salmonella enterica TaxID=28901 RepID=A0A756LA09_SALER|nr:hypothetical protein [Salmonella enterica]